jgi:chromosome segregation ATPase
LKPEDVLPQEVQGHFSSNTELTTAREHIKGLEERDQDLTKRNEALQEEAKEAKQAAKDLPADHEARLVDLKQAEHHVTFYRGLMEQAEERATKYKKKWEEAIARQTKVDDAQNKIQSLEKEVAEHEATIVKLNNENRDVSDLFDAERAKYLQTLENKEKKLIETEKTIRERDEELKELRIQNNHFEETYTGLLALMESETGDATAAVNKKALKLERAEAQIAESDRLRMAIVSEIKPLRNFYERCFDVLLIHQRLFKQLFSVQHDEVTYVPDTLALSLEAATEDLSKFSVVHDAMEAGNIANDEVRKQLTTFEINARRMHDTLKTITGDVVQFVEQLDKRPDLMAVMRYKYGKLLRGR